VTLAKDDKRREGDRLTAAALPCLPYGSTWVMLTSVTDQLGLGQKMGRSGAGHAQHHRGGSAP
jgi:hypothetical protein